MESVKVYCGVVRSYLVLLLFGDSIPICLFIFFNVFVYDISIPRPHVLFLELWPFSCDGFVGTMDIVICTPESVEKLLFDFEVVYMQASR